MKISKISLDHYAAQQANVLRMQETSRQTRIESDRKTIEKQRVENLDTKRSIDLKLGRYIDIEV